MRHISTHGSAQRALSLRLSCGAVNCQKSTDRPDVEIRISSRFTARSLCRNRVCSALVWTPCREFRVQRLNGGLLRSDCLHLTPFPVLRVPFRSQRLPAILHPYLLGLPPSGSSFRRAVAAPLAFPVRREDSMPNGIHRVKKIYSVLNIRGQKNTP